MKPFSFLKTVRVLFYVALNKPQDHGQYFVWLARQLVSYCVRSSFLLVIMYCHTFTVRWFYDCLNQSVLQNWGSSLGYQKAFITMNDIIYDLYYENALDIANCLLYRLKNSCPLLFYYFLTSFELTIFSLLINITFDRQQVGLLSVLLLLLFNVKKPKDNIMKQCFCSLMI